MLRRLSTLLLSLALLSFVSCDDGEEATPTTQPTAEAPEPAATQPAAPPTPTEEITTSTPQPEATAEPEPVEPDLSITAAGYWEGAIATSGIELGINVTFSEGDDGLRGTIDIPQQGALGLPLEKILLDGDQLHFEIAGVGAIFDGTVTSEGIEGDFTQGPATGTFEMAAAERPEEEPMDERVDLPYGVEEVEWEIDDTVVFATLTQPDGDGPFPAVILVAGSGPTDRDWNSPLLPGTNGSAALLADALTREGYVTLRYDKRVSGPAAAVNVEKLMGKLSLQSHLDEMAGGVDLLAAMEKVDTGRIFALANSEGTIHALNYQRQAVQNPLAGLILTAPPGRTLEDVMRTQMESQIAATADPEGMLALYDEAMARFSAGEPMDPSPELPEAIQQLLASLEAPANLPFTRELFVVDPAEWLLEIDVPVLVLIGKKDIQIDWQLDGLRLEETTGGSPLVAFVYPDNANHVFKYEETPAGELTVNNALLYNAADRVLDEESLAAILGWLAER